MVKGPKRRTRTVRNVNLGLPIREQATQHPSLTNFPVEPITRKIEVELPPEMYDDIVNICATRRVDVGTFARVALRAASRMTRIYGLADRFKFGKYNGEIMEAVIRSDPDYVAWCCREMTNFSLLEDASTLLDQVINGFTDGNDEDEDVGDDLLNSQAMPPWMDQ